MYIAHELRTWLLYYSLPVLKDILPANYFNHHIALVSGLYCLLKDSVQSNDLLEAKTCFEYYCSVFCDLYGELFKERVFTVCIHVTVIYKQPVFEITRYNPRVIFLFYLDYISIR